MHWAEWRYRILFGTLMFLVIVQPFLFGETPAKRLADFLLLLVLVAAVPAVSGTRRNALLAVTLALPSVFAIGSKYVAGETVLLNVIGHLLFAAFLVYVGWSLLAVVLRADNISTDQLFCALCVYLLLGVVWSLFYTSLDLSASRTPTTAHFDIAPTIAVGETDRRLPQFVYYSFVTLTTLGYGDITPVSPVARTLAWMEAFVGQLFVAVLIARLVGIHIADKKAAEERTPGEGHEPK